MKSATKNLSHRARVRIHIGTAEIIARVVLFDRPSLSPGQSAPVQFVLESPTAALPGDRYVIRTFSPLITIGGGSVLDSSPTRHKRFDDKTMAGLKKMTGNIEDAAEQVIRNAGFEAISPGEAALRLGEDENSIKNVLHLLTEQGSLKSAGKGNAVKYIHGETVDMLGRRILDSLQTYLKKNPARTSMPLAEIRSAFLQWSDKQVFPIILKHLEAEVKIDHTSQEMNLRGYRISLDPKEQQWAEKISTLFSQANFQTPSPGLIREQLHIPPDRFLKIINHLIECGTLIRLDDKVMYPRPTLAEIEEILRNFLKKKGEITISDLRDEMGLSRKYAQAILEYFDETGLTKRAGDVHILSD